MMAGILVVALGCFIFWLIFLKLKLLTRNFPWLGGYGD